MTDMTNSDLRSMPLPRRFAGVRGQAILLRGITTLFLAAGAGVIMIPFLYLLSTSVKDRDQMRQSPPPLIPMAATTVQINGQREPLYQVTMDGQTHEMALIKNQPGGKGLFVDPRIQIKRTNSLSLSKLPYGISKFTWKIILKPLER